MTRPAPENRARLDALASALLEQETLEEEDAYAAAGVTRPQATRPESSPRRRAPGRKREIIQRGCGMPRRVSRRTARP